MAQSFQREGLKNRPAVGGSSGWGTSWRTLTLPHPRRAGAAGAGSRGFPGCGCCRPAEVSLLDLRNFGLCASSAAPGQSPPTPASSAAWLQLCGRRHATVTVTVSCSPPLCAAPHCLPWFQGGALPSAGWGEASSSGWRPGPGTLLRLPQAPQGLAIPDRSGEAPGLWEGGALPSPAGLGL